MLNKRLFALFLALFLMISALPALARVELTGGGVQFVTFGSYPATATGEKQPILWRVLWAGQGRAYLLSDKILDVKRVDGDQRNYKGWLSSELHAWLQNQFIPAAFSPQEQAALVEEGDLGRVSLPSADDIKNKDFGFTDNKSRFFYGTDYAYAQGLYSYTRLKHSPIFTRTISSKAHAHRSTKVDGAIGFIGVESDDLGLLPVIWVDTTKLQAISGSGAPMDPMVLGVVGQ